VVAHPGNPKSTNHELTIPSTTNAAMSSSDPVHEHTRLVVAGRWLGRVEACQSCMTSGPTYVIALWLGHESVETTQIYLHADLAIKQRALPRTTPTGTKPGRYRPPDPLLAFLESL
jgi:integrase/recombinase XerD